MPKKVKTSNKTITQVKTSEEIKDYLNRSKTAVDPDIVLQEADKEVRDNPSNKLATSFESNIFKAMTLLEFENGLLMASAIPEQYQTFGVDMLRQLQQEFHCESVSEKATAELTAVNYIRTLEIQHRITRYLAMGTLTDTGVRYLAIMSKELDRANRHYLASVQTLKMMKQSPLQLNIKTDTAIIGQNQVVQANSHE